MKSSFALLSAFVLSVPHASAFSGIEKLYWTDAVAQDARVRRSNPDGTSIETVLAGQSHPRGLTIDALRGRMYWFNAGTNEIRSARLDGTDPQLVASVPGGFSYGVAIDPAGGKLYWCNGDQFGPNDSIRRANLDGSQIEDLVTTGLSLPVGIALDLQHGRVYWSDVGTLTIQRANLDGSAAQLVVPNINDHVYSLTIDESAGKLYWASIPQPVVTTDGFIQRSNLDGSQIETLFTGLRSPTVVLLDPSNNALVWSETYDPNTPQIVRGDLGTFATSVVVTGDGTPWGLAAGPASLPPEFNAYCFGDGALNGGPDCPCGNNVAIGVLRGCVNSTGNGGRLVSTGSASLSSDWITLTGTDMAPASFSLFLQSPANSGAAPYFFDGLRCVGPSFVRLATRQSVGGAAALGAPSTPVSVLGGVASPGTQHYQVVYRNNAGFCNFLANATNGVVVTWAP